MPKDCRKLIKVDVYLWDDQYPKMKRLAVWRQEELKDRGISKPLKASDLIRSAIDAYIAEHWPQSEA